MTAKELVEKIRRKHVLPSCAICGHPGGLHRAEDLSCPINPHYPIGPLGFAETSYKPTVVHALTEAEAVALLEAYAAEIRKDERARSGVLDITGREILVGDIVRAWINDEDDPADAMDLIVWFRNGMYGIDYKDSEYDSYPIGRFPGHIRVI